MRIKERIFYILSLALHLYLPYILLFHIFCSRQSEFPSKQMQKSSTLPRIKTLKLPLMTATAMNCAEFSAIKLHITIARPADLLSLRRFRSEVRLLCLPATVTGL